MTEFRFLLFSRIWIWTISIIFNRTGCVLTIQDLLDWNPFDYEMGGSEDEKENSSRKTLPLWGLETSTFLSGWFSGKEHHDWFIAELFNPEGSYDSKAGSSSQPGCTDSQGNWYPLVKSRRTDIESSVRKKYSMNFVVNATAIGSARQKKLREQHGCNILWAMLIDPTSACNMKCKGDVGGRIRHQLTMDLDTLGTASSSREKIWASISICIPAASRPWWGKRIFWDFRCNTVIACSWPLPTLL